MDNLDNNRNFDLASFSRAKDRMIATNDLQYGSRFYDRIERRRTYTDQEIEDIIQHGSLQEQQLLSRTFFNRDGYYKQIILYYATLLKYSGILIPNPNKGKNLSTSGANKKYYNALDLTELMNIPVWLTRCAQKALVDGAYYGLKLNESKDEFVVIDLPPYYCRVRAKGPDGRELVEFNVGYFNSILDPDERKAVLATYPKCFSKAYKKFLSKGISAQWFFLPSDIVIYLSFFDAHPLFLSVIPATLAYDEALDTQHQKDAEEVRKIIVQQIPHLADGRLLFEPDEAEEIHAGTVGMLKGDKNLSVLTSYGEVSVISSKTTEDNAANILKKIEQNIYTQAGISGQIFMAETSGSLGTAITNDLAIMMYFANKAAEVITYFVNQSYGNTALQFKYVILPISYYNSFDFVDSTFKLAGSGYSFLLPVLGVGLNQRDIVNLKDLENDILKLGEKLRPLSSSYTQSGSDQKTEDAEDGKEQTEDSGQQEEIKKNIAQTEGGRPPIKQEQKTEETIRVQEGR